MEKQPQMETQFKKLTAGDILRTRRKELGLTLEQISKETNINRGFLEAIESNNYEVFDSSVFASGFIKLYAQHLGLQVEPLLALYRREVKDPNQNTQRKSSKRNLKDVFKVENLLTRENLIRLAIALFLGIVAIGLYSDFNKYQQEPVINIISPPNNTTTTEQNLTIKGLTNLNTRILINGTEVAVRNDLTFIKDIVLNEGLNEIKITGINKINQSKQTELTLAITYKPNQQEEEAQQEKTPTQNNKLTLTIENSDAWVQLNIDKKQAVAQVLTTGYSETFDVQKEFQLVTGKPKSTKLYFNEEVVDLQINPETGTVNMTCTISNSKLKCN